MKIGLVRRGFSNSGGAENYLNRIWTELKKNKYETCLFTDSNKWKHDNLITVEGKTPIIFADNLEKINPKKYCDYLFSLERVWKCDAYRAGDGIHRSWLNRRAKNEYWIKTLFREFKKKHRQILELEKNLFSPQSNHQIIANSQLIADEINSFYNYPKEKITVIHNGFSKPKIFKKKNIRKELNISENEVVFTYLGSGWKRKGLKPLVKAFSTIKNKKTKLLVIGKNPKISNAHNIIFLDERKNTFEYLLSSDVFVLPTLYDPFSNATLEAIHANIPIITTNANGCSEVLTDKLNSSIINSEKIDKELPNALKYWQDNINHKKAKISLKEVAKNLSIEKNLKKTLSVIEKKNLF